MKEEGKGDTSVFAGFFPANAPRYVVVAVVEQGGMGAQTAAPIVRRVIESMNGIVVPAPGARAGNGPGLMALVFRRSAHRLPPPQRGGGQRAPPPRSGRRSALPFVISGLGLLMIYSSTRSRLERQGLDPTYFVAAAGARVLSASASSRTALMHRQRPPPSARDLWLLCYLVVLPLLVGVLVVGASRKGAQAWFNVGPLQFQPSEVACYR